MPTDAAPPADRSPAPGLAWAPFPTAGSHIGLSPALLVAAAALALGPLAGLRYRFQDIPAEELKLAGDWPAPALAEGGEPVGPVVVTVETGRAKDWRMICSPRWRTTDSAGGAPGPAWRVGQDAADPNRIVEQFIVASWDEHLRQHEPSRPGTRRLDKIRAMTDPPARWRPPTGGRRNGNGLPRLARHRPSRG